jgi:hypothetical protein
MRGKNTLNEALKQILELEVLKLTVGSSVRLWKASDRALWRLWIPSKTKEETTGTLRAGAVGGLATF